MGSRPSERRGAKVHCGMILSFGPRAAHRRSWAVAPRRGGSAPAPQPAMAARSMPCALVGLDRARAGDRHRHPAASAHPSPARASVRAGAVGDHVAGAGGLRRGEPLPAAGRRAARARAAGRGRRAAGLPVPRRVAPACAASRWAPLHWVLGIASYGLFGAAVLHAAMLNRAEQQMRHRRRRLRHGRHAAAAPGALTFRFVGAGLRCCRRRCCSAPGSRAALALGPQDGVLHARLAVVFAALLAGRRASAGAGAASPRAGSTAARRCCCWPTSARASCSRSCCNGRPPSEP